MKQLHKKFTDYQVKKLTTRYRKKKYKENTSEKNFSVKKTKYYVRYRGY